jgi:purine-binding chemotaxis protein CheW
MERERSDNQFLTFGIDGEIYAVPVGTVREVLEYIKPSKLPKSEGYMKGLINVRGTGIPLVDLRRKFGMSEIPVSADTAIIVMEIMPADGDQLIVGAIADEVHEVIEMDETEMEGKPRFGVAVDSDFVRNVGTHEGRFVIVLDVDRLFSAADAAAPTDAVR